MPRHDHRLGLGIITVVYTGFWGCSEGARRAGGGGSGRFAFRVDTARGAQDGVGDVAEVGAVLADLADGGAEASLVDAAFSTWHEDAGEDGFLCQFDGFGDTRSG